jgi:bifunctional non-homologous end joining protein LigD
MLTTVGDQPLEPWQSLSFVPLRPERVEVRYDHLESRRFRHTAQFLRWRPDRDPRTCTYAQLEETVGYDLADVLAPKCFLGVVACMGGQ